MIGCFLALPLNLIEVKLWLRLGVTSLEHLPFAVPLLVRLAVVLALFQPDSYSEEAATRAKLDTVGQ